MAPTSEPKAVNRFFTVAQLLAFNQPPPEAALRLVDIGGNKKAAYLEGEYIRLVMNLLVGQGMWELKTRLEKHEVTPIKKDIWDNKDGRRQVTGQADWVGISAVVHTTLIIYARDGSNDTRVYEATTVGDGMCDPKKGISDALDKAIKSAETDGLKRCAINLGKVFGLDINTKVKKDAMPLNLKHFEKVIEAARLAASNDTDALPAPDVAVPVAIAAPVGADEVDEPTPSERVPEEPITPTPVAEPAATEPAVTEPAVTEPAVKAVAPVAKEAAPVAEKPAAVAEASGKTADAATTAPSASSDGKANEAQASGTATARPAPALAEVPRDEDWELSLIPTKYDEWIRCIQTIARRISATTNEREIENFIRRNKKLIDKLPVIPPADGKPERNFKKRLATIINKRCEELGISVPAEYAVAA